jgi:hypothetical protein
MTRLEFG